MTANLVDLIGLLPEQLPPDPKRDYMKSHIGRIPKLTAQVLVGLFTAIAIIAVAFRLSIHLYKRRKLFIDDYLVLSATILLIVQTPLIYIIVPIAYTQLAISISPMYFTMFTRSEMMRLLKFLNYDHAFVITAWTTILFIKLSFLALFHVLVKNVSRKLTVFLWVVVVFSIGSWIFLAFESPINCGTGHSMKCYPHPAHTYEMSISNVVVDVVSDLMIITIPVLLLQQSQLHNGQKFRILAFLCLSVFMIGFAIARLVGSLFRDYSGSLTAQAPWANVWLHLEASVAVLMGGLTAFRTVFARQVRDQGHTGRKSASSSIYRRVRKLLGMPTAVESSEGNNEDKGVHLSVPVSGGTLKGLRTFIRRYRREPGETTVADSLVDSTYDPLESYHNFQRGSESKNKLSRDTSKTGDSQGEDIAILKHPEPVLQIHNIV